MKVKSTVENWQQKMILMFVCVVCVVCVCNMQTRAKIQSPLARRCIEFFINFSLELN